MSRLDEVREAIKNQAHHWSASMTPIAREYEGGHITAGSFGFAPGGREPGGRWRQSKAPEFAHAVCDPVPEKMDWRDHEGSNWLSPVRDQMSCGSCVAFATCAALEARLKICSEDPDLDLVLSVADLFFCGAGDGACKKGWHPADALKRCRDHGVGQEADFPYRGTQAGCKAITPAVKVTRWRRVTDALGHKETICQRGPVIGSLVVYSDFLYYSGGVYRPTTTTMIGLHSVAVVGYDDKLGCWLIKNSWGTEWGEKGFGRLGYGCCGLDAQYPFYDPDVESVNAVEPGSGSRRR